MLMLLLKRTLQAHAQRRNKLHGQAISVEAYDCCKIIHPV